MGSSNTRGMLASSGGMSHEDIWDKKKREKSVSRDTRIYAQMSYMQHGSFAEKNIESYYYQLLHELLKCSDKLHLEGEGNVLVGDVQLDLDGGALQELLVYGPEIKTMTCDGQTSLSLITQLQSTCIETLKRW